MVTSPRGNDHQCMYYGKRRKFHKNIEGVPIKRSRPVPLKVVWMGFEPLINVLVWRNSTYRWFWRMQRIFLSFLDIFDLLNPNPNDASVYMLSVLIFGWKSAIFGQKNMFLACFKTFILFSLSMRIDNSFPITFLVIQLHTYCSLCILSQKINVNFKYFWLKCQISPYARYVIKNLL